MPQLCCSSATVRNLRSIRRLRALRLSGKDATEDFEDVGHSDEARSMMAEKNDSGIKIVGTIEGEVPESMKAKKSEDVRAACVPCQLSGPLPSPFDLVTAAAPHPSALCDAPLRNPLRCSVVRRCAPWNFHGRRRRGQPLADPDGVAGRAECPQQNRRP